MCVSTVGRCFGGHTSKRDFDQICSIVEMIIRPDSEVFVEYTSFLGGEWLDCFKKDGIQAYIQHGFSEDGIYLELAAVSKTWMAKSNGYFTLHRPKLITEFSKIGPRRSQLIFQKICNQAAPVLSSLSDRFC